MHRYRRRTFAVITAGLLVLTACGAEEDQDAAAPDEGTADEALTEDAATETPAGEDDGEDDSDEEESEVYTMLELHERDPEEARKLEELREVVAADAVPVDLDLDEPVKIAFVYPSFDLSEGWSRGATAFEARLDEFGFPYELQEFGSAIDDHTMQANHISTILAGDWDYVLLGPTELDTQRTVIRDLIDDPDTEVIIWNYNTPIREWDEMGQPLSYVGFDHAEGGQLLCEWMKEEVEPGGTFATMHFTLGFLDDQRVGTFVECIADHMEHVYEHFADGTREMAYEGTNAAVAAHPDLTHIHAANTATALGTLSALQEQGLADEIIVNGWGGGQEELDSILEGGLKVTPMRMQDDFGVIPAEMIRMHLEGNADSIPLIASGEIVLVDYRFSEDDVAELTEYAFRYSGVTDR